MIILFLVCGKNYELFCNLAGIFSRSKWQRTVGFFSRGLAASPLIVLISNSNLGISISSLLRPNNTPQPDGQASTQVENSTSTDSPSRPEDTAGGEVEVLTQSEYMNSNSTPSKKVDISSIMNADEPESGASVPVPPPQEAPKKTTRPRAKKAEKGASSSTRTTTRRKKAEKIEEAKVASENPKAKPEEPNDKPQEPTNKPEESKVKPEEPKVKTSDIHNFINAEQPQLLPSALPQDPLASDSQSQIPLLLNFDEDSTSTTTSSITTPLSSTVAKPKTKPKAKQAKKESTSSKQVKKVTKKSEESKQVTPESDPVTTFTKEQISNKSLKPPNPNASIPPPKVVEIQQSPFQEPSKQPPEPIIALHVPLTSSKGTDSEYSQVVFNVMKMAEDKYGWKSIHPNASRYALELLNEDDDDDEDDVEEVDEEETAISQPVDGRKSQKGKPKVGQYDMNDPFIDDAETLWEEQRASTKDGFFVFYGPLVEEGKTARIERADGTIKRTSRKRPATSNHNSSSANKKKAVNRSIASRPLIAIAPTPIAPKP